MEYNNFNSSRCNICFFLKLQQHIPLKLCQNCKLVGYCSLEHQKIDWSTHKDFCNKIRQILRMKNINHILDSTPEQKNIPKCKQVKISMNNTAFLLSNLLRRSLVSWESIAILSVKLCNICSEHSSALHLNCPNCHNVFYCSLDHLKRDEKDHSTKCMEYKVNLETDLHDFREIDIANIVQPEPKLHTFPADLLTMINLLCKPSSNNSINICSLAPFSWITTIIYSLKKSDSIFNHQQKTDMVIHLIGVEDEACFFNENSIKLIFHIFKKLMFLKLNFCGPNMQISETTRVRYSFEGGRNVEITSERIVYEKCTHWSVPDLILSFNCGFHEIQNCSNPWSKAIQKMIKYKNIPIAFTSYTYNESKKDFETILSIAQNKKDTIAVVSLNSKNPFRNIYPLKNIYSFETEEPAEPFYYINNYICILYVPGNGNAIPTS